MNQPSNNSADRLRLYLGIQLILENGKKFRAGNTTRLASFLGCYESLKKCESIADENYIRVMNRIKELADGFFEHGFVTNESLSDFEYFLLRTIQTETGEYSQELEEEIKKQEQA